MAILVAGARAAKDDTVLVSRAGGAAGAKGNGDSRSPSVSTDGRFVAFESFAGNLSPADPDTTVDVFVRDLRTDAVTLVSRAGGAAGAKGNGDSLFPSISSGGRLVAFRSVASNLSPDDPDTSRDVYVRNLQTDATTLVSRAGGAAGAKGNGDSLFPSISSGGRFVAFESSADNLNTADSDTASDVFVRDLQTNATTLVSRAGGASGAKGNGGSFSPSISADGRFVAFRSVASNLSTDDSDTTGDVFVRDRQTNATTLVSRAAGGTGAKGNGGSFSPSVSADGRYVGFESTADNLSPADGDATSDVFVRDLQGNTTTLASRAEGATGVKGNGGSSSPSISAEGRFVGFASFADNLSPDDGDNAGDVFVRDLQENATTLVSRADGATGGKGNGGSRAPSVSTSAHSVAFESSADNLSSADSDTIRDVFVRGDLTAPEPPTLTDTDPNSPANDNSPRVKGTAEAGSTVRVYAGADCSGTVAATGTATTFSSPGLTVTVADDSTTSFRVTATDAAGNTSPCSTSSISYTEDSTPPGAPLLTDTDPNSPANDNSPSVKGTAQAGSTVRVYRAATAGDCTVANLAATGAAAEFTSPGLTVSVSDDSTTTFRATSTDAAGNVSACSASSISYTEDSTPPGAPLLTDTDPNSPANDNSPSVKGTAQGGSTVRVYTAATPGDCTTTNLAATGSAASFSSPGLTVSVADDSSTRFRATATDTAGNVSPCSPSSIVYAEDSTPPAAPQVTDSDPASPANDNSPRLTGTAEVGSTVRLYRAAATGDCSPATLAATGGAAEFASPGLTVSVSDNSTTTFRATATDAAGNSSGCSASSIVYAEDSTAPAPPTLTDTDPNSPANENSPEVKGTALAGSTVRVYRSSDCSGVADVTGSAASFSSPGLAVSVGDDSTTTFRATATDAAGNTSACSSSSVVYREDSSPPARPTLTATAPVSPANDNSPNARGTAEAGSTVRLYKAATAADCTEANLAATGSAASFSTPGLTVSVADDSATRFRASATDAAGNLSPCSSSSIAYTEDSTPPSTPTLTDTDPGSPANDNSPRLKGTAQTGSTVRLYRAATAGDCSPANLAATGAAAEFASSGLTVSVADNSTTTFRATATDAAGNSSGCSPSSIVYTEDSTAPGGPLLNGTDPSSPANDNSPSVKGAAQAGSTVRVYKASTTVDCTAPNLAATGSAGTFITTGLSVSVPDDSTTTFRATATDSAGNTSACSASSAVYGEDSTPPARATLTGTAPSSPANDNSPRVEGTAEAGSTVRVYRAATAADCTEANLAATGSAASFSSGLSVAVSDDSASRFRATATDAASNTSPCSSSSVVYTEDSTPPSPPTLTDTDPGSPANHNLPRVKGTAEAGSTVRLYRSADCSGSAAATGNASDFAAVGLSTTVGDDSTTTFRGTSTDAAGNTSDCSSSSIVYREDSTAPAAPTVSATVPGSPANDNSPSVKGTTQAGSTVRLYRSADCTGQGAATGSAETFSSSGLTVSVADDSTTSFRATATDAAGNTSACSSSSIIYREDSTPPAAPALTDTDPNSPANDNSPRVKGTVAAGSRVRLYKAATAADCTAANLAATGSAADFSTTGLSVSVADDSTTTFRATATDAAGNTSACSSGSIVYREDSTAPGAPTLTATNPSSPANDNSPRVNGTAQTGSTVRLYSADTTADCTAPNLAATGAAAPFSTSGLAVAVSDDSTTRFRATATDPAGNVSGCSSSSVVYVEDSSAPAVPTLTETNPSSPANDNSPSVKGTAEAGSTVRLYEAATTTDCTAANLAATGTAAELASSGLTVSVANDSTTRFRATATDAAGNTSPCSPGSIDYREDSTPPAPPQLTDSDPNSPANDNSPKLKGTVAPGARVRLYRAATVSDCTPANLAATGAATDFSSAGLSVSVANDSTTRFRATATDAAGNPSDCSSSSIVYTEDSTAPARPTLTGTDPVSPANDNSPTVQGTAQAGSAVHLYTSADCSGAVAATGTAAELSSPGLAVSVADDTTTSLRATATDAAGNVSPCSSSSIVYVEDSSAPAAPTLAETDPSSPANDNSPNVKGTAETGSTVRLYKAGTAADCTTPNLAATGPAAGFTTTGLSVSVPDDSTTSFRGTATDAAGNVSPCSAGIVYREDSTPPAVPQVSDTDPNPPANDNSPEVKGTAAPGTTVRLYRAVTAADCTVANLAATGTAAGFSGAGLSVSVPDDSTTRFRATAADAAGNASACSTTSVVYTEDSTAPAAPVLTDTTPNSPANDNAPEVKGTAEAGSTVHLYRAATATDCTTANLAATGTAAELASSGLTVSVADDSTTTFRASATDASGNASPCFSSSIVYVEDSTAPVAPSLTATEPTSPANDNSPKVKGSAEAGSTVRLYRAATAAGCTAANLAATGPAADFSTPGLSVSVPDNTTTRFRATASDAAGNSSGCSASSVVYVEDST